MKRPAKNKAIPGFKRILILTAAITLLAAAFIWVRTNPVSAPFSNNSKVSDNEAAEFNKSVHSLNDPASPWVIVNKGRLLGNYTPADLVLPAVPLRVPGTDEMKMRKEAAEALEIMFDAAEAENARLMVTSAYRSYNYQKNLYNRYVSTQGQAITDATSARPGHSEHQTGWSVDVAPTSRKCELDKCFAETAEGRWVAANSFKHGFIIRYPESKQQLTGYDFEPWHLRYVGKELAEQIHQHGQVLEQFFGLPTYADYPEDIYLLSAGS